LRLHFLYLMAHLAFEQATVRSDSHGTSDDCEGATPLLPPTARRPWINVVSHHPTIVTQGQKRLVQWQAVPGWDERPLRVVK